MNRWKECKLGEHVAINARSIDKSYPHEEIEYLDTGSITEGKIDSFQYFNLADAPSRAKRIVRDNDIIISMVRPIQRHYGYIRNPKPNTVVSTGFVVLSCKATIDPYFLYSFLTQEDITEYLNVVAEGSTSAYPAFTPDILENLSIDLPSISEQRAIAGVLSSLDDKIDLLHRQNKTLEGMAEALWRKMFVEDADPNWKKGKLGDICHIQNGYAFKSSDYQEYQFGFLEVLKMGHIRPGGGLRHDPKKDYVPNDKHLKHWILDKYDIVLAMTDMKDNMVILGNPALIDKGNVYVLNQRVARIILKNKEEIIHPVMLYLQMKSADFISELQSTAHSGVQVNLTTDSIKNSSVVIPPMVLQEKVSELFIRIYCKTHCNIDQIRTLSHLRNIILPKLMSSELKIKL